MGEPDPREAWHEQVLIYAAHGPTDRSQSRRYYVVAILIVCMCFAAILVIAELAPENAPPPTTVPALTFPTLPP